MDLDIIYMNLEKMTNSLRRGSSMHFSIDHVSE